MDKIYRRETQTSGTPRKKRNEKNRIRNQCINFHVTPNEKKLIENRIRLSGLPKGKFFIESCLYQTILVKGNVKSFGEIRTSMEELSKRINWNTRLEELEPEQRESIRMILEILNSMFGKE